MMAQEMHEVAGAPSDRDGPPTDLGTAALTGNFWHYRDMLRTGAQELDFAKQDALITDVADGIGAEELLTEEPQNSDLISRAVHGRDARIQLAVSFSERVVNIVLRNCRRVDVWTSDFQEETMQVGMLGLLKSIVGFAKIPSEERGGFWAYAQKVVINDIREATRENFLGHTIRREDRQTAALGKYLEARNHFIDQHGRFPFDTEIADTLAITLEHAYTLRQLSSRTLAIDRERDGKEDEPDFVHTEQEWPTNPEAEILIERALEFFPPEQQAMIRLRFGIGEQPQLTVGEIATTLNVKETSVSTAFSRDVKTLGELITGLVTETLDYKELRTRQGLRGRNVVTMFHLLGEPLPKEARLQELRERAKWHLGKLITSDRDRQIVCRLYGLDSPGENVTHQEIATEFAMSKQNIGVIERRVLGQLAKEDGADSDG